MIFRLDNESRIRLERHVLQAMCRGTREGSVREVGKALLKTYRWREPIHQAIFACLVELAAGNLDDLRSDLAQRMTRKGFPDIEWNDFFAPCSLSRQEAEGLMRELSGLD
jgi:hypothetical protein